MVADTAAQCKVIMIAAAGSGQGKTLITAALARSSKNQGNRVQVFKVGPDYLDPTILECASGQPVLNLDLWMMGESHCRKLLFDAARDNDLVLVESLMGLHDNQPSSAHLARLFGIPVVLVLNVAKYAQTAGAVVEGLQKYGSKPEILAVIGNRTGSDNHDRIMAESMGCVYAGSLRRDDRLELPSRHLGLVQASEIADLDKMLDIAAELFEASEIKIPFREVQFAKPESDAMDPRQLLDGRVIAIARDAAFSFVYPENIRLLERMGAQIAWFSPLGNNALPECDAVWIPGGYPELYLQQIAQAERTRQDLQHHQTRGKPMLAECGGMMAMCRTITDSQGNSVQAIGLLDADCSMTSIFQSVGLQGVDYEAGQLRGHAFHHSLIRTNLIPDRYGVRQSGEQGEPVFRIGASVFTYLHHYFPFCPSAAARFFI